jgi:hypothetical protein
MQFCYYTKVSVGKQTTDETAPTLYGPIGIKTAIYSRVCD